MSLISGNATFNSGSINKSENEILGISTFCSNSINSGTIGTGFFIESSVNLGSVARSAFSGSAINRGNASGACFFQTSQNCSTAYNALFCGAINQSTVCGTTVFCNSNSYGYVCGTGILRGSSVLYGAADCVIQCDQSRIDAGASVASSNFLVTTGFPTNIYSNDSCYYTYSSGACTLATGGWSNYYFLSGSASYLNIQTGASNYAVVYQAQDNCLYYAAAYGCGLACLANGAYYNGYYNTGCLNSNFYSIYAINPRGLFPAENEAPNQWYLTYNSGTVAVANGLLPRAIVDGEIFLDFFQNGFVDLPSNSTVGMKYISTINSYVCLLSTFGYESCCPWYGCSQVGYIYCFATPTGVTSSGYFNSSCQGLDICSFLSAVGGGQSDFKAMSIDVTFTCNSPLQAQDNCLYYTYCTGGAIVANGLYSNYAMTGGAIDATCSTNMPAAAIDCGCQIYETGTALCVSYVNYILDNNCYYWIYWAPTQETNYSVESYKTNTLKKSLIAISNGVPIIVDYNAFGGCCGGLAMAIGNCSFRTSCNNFENCFFIVDSSYNCSSPQPIVNKYFLYCGGSGIVPSGLYSNYHFNNDLCINTNFTCRTPQCAQDTQLFYIYCTGGAIMVTGAYSNGYYSCTGSFDDSFSSATPIQANDCCLDTEYYTYLSGAPTLANGAYTIGYYTAGFYDFNYSCSIPIDTIDSNFYTFVGNSPLQADGPYSNGYYLIGNIDETIQSVYTACDNSCVYRYTNGVAMYTVCAQGTNVGFICCNVYDVGACFQGGCGDGTITVAGDCSFLIGCTYCCADGADACAPVYCSFGAYVCYCLYDAGSETYCLACCFAVNQ